MGCRDRQRQGPALERRQLETQLAGGDPEGPRMPPVAENSGRGGGRGKEVTGNDPSNHVCFPEVSPVGYRPRDVQPEASSVIRGVRTLVTCCLPRSHSNGSTEWVPIMAARQSPGSLFKMRNSPCWVVGLGTCKVIPGGSQGWERLLQVRVLLKLLLCSESECITCNTHDLAEAAALQNLLFPLNFFVS